MLIHGTKRGEKIVGTDEADKIVGGRGRDILDGQGGDDTLVGGRGRDIFVINNDATLDLIKDFRSGVDTVAVDWDITDTPTGSNITYNEETGALSVYEWDEFGTHPGPTVALIQMAHESNRFGSYGTDYFLI